MTIIRRVVCLAALAALLGSAAQAQEALTTKPLSAATAARANKALAKSFREPNPNVRRRETIVNRGCGNVGVGNVNLGRGQRAPRDLTVVIQDVTVINDTRGCR